MLVAADFEELLFVTCPEFLNPKLTTLCIKFELIYLRVFAYICANSRTFTGSPKNLCALGQSGEEKRERRRPEQGQGRRF